LLASLAPAVLGCQLLVPVDDLSGGTRGDGSACVAGKLESDPDNCGACGRSCRGGACVSARCQPIVIADGQARPLGIGVSPNHVLWVNQRLGGLFRAAKDGGSVTRLDGAGDGIQDPFDIASDTAETAVYWTELASNMIYRKALPGGPKESYGPGPGTAGFVVVDGASAFVSDFDPNGTSGVIQGGGAAMGQQVLYSERDGVAGLAVQPGVLFWARRTAAHIVSAPTTGGVAVSLVAEGTPGSRIMGVAADDAFVYWIEDGARIRRASRTSGAATTLHEAAVPFGDGDLAVDDRFVFWTESGSAPGAAGVVRRLVK
jgi:hypothetical protein